MSNRGRITRECEHLNRKRNVFEGSIDNRSFFQNIRGDLLVSGESAGDQEMILNLVESCMEKADMPIILLSGHPGVFTEAFYGAMDMKEELALAALEWNYQYNSVRTRERQLLEALEEAEHRVYEIDTEEGIYQYNNGIDYWTFGQLTILRNQIATARAYLEHAEEMKLPQLQEAEEELYSLQEQLLLLENAAHINVAMSVSRYETASKIGAILDDNYEMMDADGEFFAREDREEYHALFQNPVTRDQVAVVITPIPDEGGVVTNHIELIVGNADNNPVTRDRIAQEVAEKLRSAGLEGCSFAACSGRYGDHTPQEVARVSDMTAVERGDEKVRATKPVGAVQTDTVTSRVRRTQKAPVASTK